MPALGDELNLSHKYFEVQICHVRSRTNLKEVVLVTVIDNALLQNIR